MKIFHWPPGHTDMPYVIISICEGEFEVLVANYGFWDMCGKNVEISSVDKQMDLKVDAWWLSLQEDRELKEMLMDDNKNKKGPRL